MTNDHGESVFNMATQLCTVGADPTHDEIARTLYGPKKHIDPTVANYLAWMALEQAACAVEYALQEG